MRIFQCFMLTTLCLYCLANPFAVVSAGERPDALERLSLKPGAPRNIESPKPDLAVTAIFYEHNCFLKYTVENQGGRIDPLPPHGMGITLCDKNGFCMNNIQNTNALAGAGSQETFTWVPAKPQMTPPYTVTIYPPVEENKSNNSLTRDLQCAQ